MSFRGKCNTEPTTLVQLPDPYLFPVKSPRPVPQLHFTPLKIFTARFKDNTTLGAVNVGLILPASTLANAEFNRRIKEAEDLEFTDVKEIFVTSFRVSLSSYADRLLRIFFQTAAASALSLSTNSAALSTVYLWDLGPRSSHYHFDAVVKRLRLPPFISLFLGPQPSVNDVAFIGAPTSLLAATEDCVKRKVIFALGDVLAIALRQTLSFFTRGKVSSVSPCGDLFQSLLVYPCGILGGVVGYSLAGHTGEFWGDIVGTAFAPTFHALYYSSVRSMKKKKSSGHHKSGSKPHKKTQ